MSRAAPSILHLDLDAFYASVEQLARPALRGRPVVVGGLGPRGVVAAASYEARRYGIHSAMPTARARRLAPGDAAFLAPRFDAYQAASEAVMAIVHEYTELVEQIALDEAFLDVGPARRRVGEPGALATELRARVCSETGLVASVGAATTKLLAKIASDLAKPDGLHVVEPGTELEVLHPLEVTRVWGVGPATQRRLERLGVHTVGELARVPEASLVAALGDAQGRQLHALAFNDDPRPVVADREVKSVGHEETFPTDVTDRRSLEREARSMAERVASRLRAAGRAGRTVQLKVRYGDFRTITRSHTRREPTDLAAEVAAEALRLLARVQLDDGVRLLGVAVQQLGAVAVQQRLSLDDEPRVDRASLERSVDAVRERFGPGALGVGPGRR